MLAHIGSLLVGIACIVMGVTNMRGNISSLHSYHRHRVSEEDKVPFGKKVGLGTVMIGCGVTVFSVLSAITHYTENEIFVTVGIAIMLISMVVGLGISFGAMMKYNKGIF